MLMSQGFCFFTNWSRAAHPPPVIPSYRVKIEEEGNKLIGHTLFDDFCTF